jgi:hypothetical protein
MLSSMFDGEFVIHDALPTEWPDTGDKNRA